jgi:hypothetical protein
VSVQALESLYIYVYVSIYKYNNGSKENWHIMVSLSGRRSAGDLRNPGLHTCPALIDLILSKFLGSGRGPIILTSTFSCTRDDALFPLYRFVTLGRMMPPPVRSYPTPLFRWFNFLAPTWMCMLVCVHVLC